MKNLACAAIVGMAVGLGALSVGGGGAASLASLAAVRLLMVVAYLPISRPYLAHISPISPQALEEKEKAAAESRQLKMELEKERASPNPNLEGLHLGARGGGHLRLEIWGRYRRDMGEIWARYRGDTCDIWSAASPAQS